MMNAASATKAAAKPPTETCAICLEDFGETDVAHALTAQTLKCLWQVELNGGNWRIAWSLTGLADPLARRPFAGDEEELEVAAGWEEAYYGSFSGAAGSDGERPVVVSYASSPPAEVIFAEEPLEDAPTGVVTESCYRQIEFAGILSGTEHEEAAQQLIDFMLSPTFQEDIPLNMFVYPVTDVELPDEFVLYGAEPQAPYLVDAEVVAENRDDWIEEWTEIVLR